MNLPGKMTERMMSLIYLHKRREFAAANVFRPIASLGKRTTGRQMSNIRRQARDLVELFTLFVSRIGNAF